MQRPEVLQAGHLADLIVLRQLFVFFLPEMCSPGPQQDLFRNITEQAFFFGEQLEVMGFNPANEVAYPVSLLEVIGQALLPHRTNRESFATRKTQEFRVKSLAGAKT